MTDSIWEAFASPKAAIPKVAIPKAAIPKVGLW